VGRGFPVPEIREYTARDGSRGLMQTISCRPEGHQTGDLPVPSLLIGESAPETGSHQTACTAK